LPDGKSALKGLARPFLKPLLARIGVLDRRVGAAEGELQRLQAQVIELAHAQQQISEHQQQILRMHELVASMEPRMASVEKQLPVLEKTVTDILDALSSQNAVARDSRRTSVHGLENLEKVQAELASAIDRLERRVEALRRE
jgi:predicted  nucleic acid-binding Zn-ribbon protein